MKADVPISVVIPAHNEESFIEEAIRSVHNQTLKVSEIIVVADDCTDRTADIAQKLGATVLDHSNRNMAIGLNMAVKSTNQPWIAFLDAHDYWHTEKIAYQWKAITDYPAAALVFCDLSMILNDEIILNSSRKCASEQWDNLENVVRKGSSRFA